MSVIRQLDSLDAGFLDTLGRLLAFESATDTRIEDAVSEILAGVKAGGDAAIIEYTRRFDQLDVAAMSELELPRNELEAALAGLPERH